VIWLAATFAVLIARVSREVVSVRRRHFHALAARKIELPDLSAKQ
jgi:hypothetical protein